MDNTAEVILSPKKERKSRWGPVMENISPSEESEGDPGKVIQNGTGNSSSDNVREEEIVQNKPKAIKITKITKSTKTELPKERSKSPGNAEPSVAPTLIQCDSPTSSQSSDNGFCGFDSVVLSEKQSEKQDAIHRILNRLSTSGDAGSSGKTTGEDNDLEESNSQQEGGMTVDAGRAVDSDSDHMEIDMGNDKDTSSDFSERHDKSGERTKDSDVDIMEIDSVGDSGGNTISKKDEENKTDSVVADSSILESPVKETPTLPLNADAKPLLSVRKDLAKIVTPPQPAAKRRSAVREGGRTPKIDISNPAFLKPFDFGWKRELVFRSTNDTHNRRQGDIYYYTPQGKKLRSLREISDHLVGTELTQDNFTFWKEPIGIDDPLKEIIRDAKFKLVHKDPTASPSEPKKTTPKITKTPKVVKTTPKLTATVTPLDSTGTTPPTPVMKASASVTPRVVLKGKTGNNAGPKFKVTPNKNTVPGQSHKIVISKEKKRKAPSDDELEMGMLPPMWEPIPKPKETKLTRPMDVCSIRCLPAMGLIPTLQCHVCLCLYHPECVGLEEANHRTIHSYKCKNCQMEKPKAATGNSSKAILPPPPLTPISTMSTTAAGVTHGPMAPPKLQRMMDGKPITPRGRVPVTKTTSIVGGVTTWLPPSSTIQLRPPPPTTSKLSPSQKPLPPTTTAMLDAAASQPVQTLVSMDCRRYIVVPKHNVLSVSPATTSSIQVADPVSTQITTAASDPSATVSTLTSQAYGPGGPILPKPQVTTSAAFIVGSPTSTTSTFQNPPGVLLVPYISPQTSPTQKDVQQPQYIVVNGPAGLQSGNFIFGNIPQQQQLKLPTVPTSQPAEPPLESAGTKRPLENAEEAPAAKRPKVSRYHPIRHSLMQDMTYLYQSLVTAFQYLKVQELLRASRVCQCWKEIAHSSKLWEKVHMKNSQVKDWEGFSATLRRAGTKHLDLRKILMPDKQDALRVMWSECVKALSKVNTLVKLDLCRCTSYLLEQIAAVCPQLEYIAAGAIKSSQLNLTNVGNCQNLTELKLKSQNGMDVNNAAVLANLTKLKQLSLTTAKNMNQVLEVIGKMTQLESLELGDFVSVTESVVTESFSQLTKIKRIRLEKGQQDCPTDVILQTLSRLPTLVQLELINFDVKSGFEDALGLCSNIRILLIIPTYVTQSATTNHLVIEGVSKLSTTLNHFVWGLTLELLRVTDLFIDQWEMGQKNAGAKTPNQVTQKKSTGDSIPILKPSNKDGKKQKEGGVTQVDVLQLPKLHKVLTTLLPNTKIIILKVPFSATWRQTIAGSNITQ